MPVRGLVRRGWSLEWQAALHRSCCETVMLFPTPFPAHRRSGAAKLGRLAPIAMLCSVVVFSMGMPGIAAEPPGEQQLATDYASDIQPLLKRYCSECHSADKPEADLNLA